MGKNSAIGWTDHTYNPWRGCTKVGPGCVGCYAAARDLRYESGKDATEPRHWGPGAPRIRAALPTLRAPLKWAKAAAAGGPRKVFALSLGDVFDNEVDPAWRREFWDMVRITPELDYQLVTKRIGNADKMMPECWPTGFAHVGIIATVVNQEEVDRDVPKLLALKDERNVTWVGLSIEPQLGPINVSRFMWPVCEAWPALYRSAAEARAAGAITTKSRQRLVHADCVFIDWIISGGESAQPGHPPRPYDLAWGRSLRDQCAAAGVAFFQKQLGARPVMMAVPPTLGRTDLALKDHRAGAEPSEWPADMNVRQFPEALR